MRMRAKYFSVTGLVNFSAVYTSVNNCGFSTSRKLKCFTPLLVLVYFKNFTILCDQLIVARES